MARLTKAYFSSFHTPKPIRARMTKDELRKFQVDFNGALDSETVSSATWTNPSSNATLTISGPTLSAGIATCSGEALTKGTARIHCVATLSTGRKLKQWFHVRVSDEADVR